MSVPGLAIPLVDLLRLDPDLTESVRLRMALDLLEQLAGSGAIELVARTDRGPRLEHVAVDAVGIARLETPGDGSGAAVLVWEVLAGRAARGPELARLHDVLDEVHPDVDAVVWRALSGSPSSLDELVEELERAAEGHIATHGDVVGRLALLERRAPSARGPSAHADLVAAAKRLVEGVPTTPPPSVRAPRTASASTRTPRLPPASVRTPPPPPASVRTPQPPPAMPSPNPFEEDWEIPDHVGAAPAPTPRQTPPPRTPPPRTPPPRAPPPRTPPPGPLPPPRPQAPSLPHMEQVKQRAEERAAALRAGAEALAGARAAAARAEAERAAEEASLRREDELRVSRASAADRAAIDLQRQEESAATDSLNDASAWTAKLLSGTFDGAQTPERRPTVLLIHAADADSNRLTIALENAGYEVIARQDGTTALTVAAYIGPSCIVCDYDLPDSNGDSIARRVRKSASDVALTPFVLLASPADTRAGLARFALGADVCLMKPVRPQEVVAQVGALLAMVARLRATRQALPSLPTGRSAAFRGDLVQVSIASLLTLIELEQRTGVFEVTNAESVARLEVASGLLVSGRVAAVPMSPVGALRVMLAWRTGEFSFTAAPSRAAPQGAATVSDALALAMRFEGTVRAMEPFER